jgi:hypothetical protein
MAKTKGDDAEKIQVTFNTNQIELIDRFRGVFGNTKAEIVRYIVANWLFENEIKKRK